MRVFDTPFFIRADACLNIAGHDVIVGCSDVQAIGFIDAVAQLISPGETGLCQVAFTEIGIGRAQVREGDGELRVEFNGMLKEGDGVLCFTLEAKVGGQRVSFQRLKGRCAGGKERLAETADRVSRFTELIAQIRGDFIQNDHNALGRICDTLTAGKIAPACAIERLQRD